MAKKKEIDYNLLLQKTLKEKLSYLLIGMAVLLFGGGFAVYSLVKQYSPIQSSKEAKNSVTAAPSPLLTPAPSPTAQPAPYTEETPRPYVNPTEAAKAAEAKPGEGHKEYKVKPGDTLWKIAEEAYKSGFNYRDLARYNNLYNPNLITSGQTILMPTIVPDLPTDPDVLARGGVGGPTYQQGEILPEAAMTAPITDSSTTYVVKPGDTLWSIAEKTLGDGFSWTTLAQKNNVADRYNLKVGTTLQIPR